MFVPLIGEQGWQEGPAHGHDARARRSPPAGNDRASRRGAADYRRSGLRRHVRSFWRSSRRASRRGKPRHVRVLPCPRRDHPAADRAARLLDRRGRGGLADAAPIDRYVRHAAARGRGSRLSSASPPGCGATPTSRPLRAGCASTTKRRGARAKAGFNGLDIYNMRGTIAAVLAYLDEVDPDAAAVARERYGCLTPWQNEPATYGRAVLTSGYRKCEEAVVETMPRLARAERSTTPAGRRQLLDAAQNARLVASAEKYYRIMYYGGAKPGTCATRHMFETLEQLLEPAAGREGSRLGAQLAYRRRPPYRNGALREELNIGQLCSERFGDAAALIGFGTHSGTVAGASDWDGEMEVKQSGPRSRTVPSGFAMTAAKPPSCSISAADDMLGRAPAGTAAGALHRRHLPPRDGVAQPLLEPVCPDSSMPWCGSTNLGGHAAPCGWRHCRESSGHLPIRPLSAPATPCSTVAIAEREIEG